LLRALIGQIISALTAVEGGFLTRRPHGSS